MDFKELIENSLYKTSAEKDALEKDKDKIAEAFVYNFLGIIGLINATSVTQHSHMKSVYFSKDKKVQLANIGDDNNDISLVIKLVNDAGFFKNATIPLEITRFLAKLKQSSIDEIDTTIGVKNKDYNAKCLGNDNILSPEWCVFNPKAQLSIYKVYEVELVTSDGIKKYLKEETSFKGFKQFMKTDTSITSFIIRDGLIPIFDIHNNVSYLDFEDAANKLPKNAAIDYTMAGPVIVFKNTKNQENFDIRFGQTMGKTIFDTYKKCWNNK